MVEITAKQKRMAEMKSKGLSNREIAAIEYPHAKLHAGDVIVSRELKKLSVAKYVDKGREAALRRYSITWDRVIAKLNFFLDSDNNNLQMQALRTILPMLEHSEPIQKQDYTELSKAINSNIDDVELQRIVFKKTNP